MRIYLDHNASAPLHPAARIAMADALALAGNPSSIHGAGRKVRGAIERARRAVAALIAGGPAPEAALAAGGAAPEAALAPDTVADGVVFTSGGTEAILAGVTGLARLAGGPAVIAVVATEHPAVHGAAAAAAAATGGRVVSIAVDARGVIDPRAWRDALAARPAVVAISACNHELGVLPDLPALARAARAAGARVFVDAVQAAGKLPLGPIAACADALAISAHKLGGPAGTGALWTAAGVALAPLHPDGHQERGRRAGTENAIGIAGFGAAAAAFDPAATAATAARGARLEAALRTIPGARIHGDGAPRLTTTVNAGFDGVRGEALVIALDLEGVAASTGAACTSGSIAPSPVLRALGLSDEQARGGLRLSLGPSTTDAEIDEVIALVPRLVARARGAG